MFRVIALSIIITTVLLVPLPVSARSYKDTFKEVSDDWTFGYSLHTPWVLGNWRIEDGSLINDQAGDDFFALYGHKNISEQTVRTNLTVLGPSGYGGIIYWYTDDGNWSAVRIYPAAGEVWVSEVEAGVSHLFRYPLVVTPDSKYDMSVRTQGEKEKVKISINGDKVIHQISTNVRKGRTGLLAGNAGAIFDSFRLSY